MNTNAMPRTKIPATVSRRKAPEVEAVFRREVFSDEFLRVPCAFQWNASEMRRIPSVPAVHLSPGCFSKKQLIVSWYLLIGF
jgi:hypothetical protein